jgi:fibronectin-binding autotransporter adhesin
MVQLSRYAAAVGVSALLLCGRAEAQTSLTWVGGTGSDWSTTANWSPSGPPTGDTVIFSTGAPTSIVDSPFSIVSLEIQSALTLSGSGALTISSGLCDSSSGAVVISASIGGCTSVASTGGGTLTLSGSNSYTGGTTISDSGILIVGSASALGASSGALTLGNGATLENAGSTSLTLANAVNLGAGGDSNSVTLKGPLAFSGEISAVASSTTVNFGSGSKVALTGGLDSEVEGSSLVLQGGGGNATPSVMIEGTFNSCENFSQVTITGVALVLDSSSENLNIGSKELYLGTESAQGYVGYTETTGASPSQFLSLIDECTVNGVIGFDSHNPESPVNIACQIDLTQGGEAPFTSNTFLGTSTAAQLSGCIIPVSASIGYKFTGVNGGQLNVATNLGDDECPTGVTIGLPTPMEVNGSISSVILSGMNCYSGGTFLDSGILYVTNSESLGGSEGDTLTANSASEVAHPILAAYGGIVTLPNDIALNSNGLVLGLNYESPKLTLTGQISGGGTLYVNGPADLEGGNTYSEGTYVTGTTLTVGTDTGLGSGPLTAADSTVTFNSGSPTLNSPTLNGATLDFTDSSGSPVINGLVMSVGSVINFEGGSSPTIENMSSDTSASDQINLGVGGVTPTALTVDVGVDPTFMGTINGNGSLAVVGSGGNAELDLSGVNTYTGGTTVSGNALVVAENSSALGTGPLVLNSGAVFGMNTGITIANAITVNPGASVGGYGSISPTAPQTVTFGAGSRVVGGRGTFGSGGDSSLPIIGTLNFGATATVVFAPGSGMEFSMQTAANFSSINLAGSLNITANAGDPFTVYIVGVDSTNQIPGTASSFDNTTQQAWTLVQANTLTISGGFNALDFTVNTSNFSNPLGTTGGNFFVTQGGTGNDSLILNFTPVPEPSTWILMAGGLSMMVGAAVRRRLRA